MEGRGRCRVVRTSLGTVLFGGLLLFLFICILSNQAKEKEAIATSSTRNLNLHGGSLNLNYVSKRRVPNGPDPIHNRRARNYKESPTRV